MTRCLGRAFSWSTVGTRSCQLIAPNPAPHRYDPDVAAMADDSQVEHGEQEVERSSWASFTRADTRHFLITSAGTVAANVVTVMVVAIAVILARPPAGARAKPAAVLLDLGVVVIGVMTHKHWPGRHAPLASKGHDLPDERASRHIQERHATCDGAR